MRVLFVLYLGLATVLSAAPKPNVVGADAFADAKRELEAGRPEAALALLPEAEKQCPTPGLALALRGSVYLEQGKIAEAIEAFRAAHETNKTIWPPQIFLADAMFRQRKWDEARAVYEGLRREARVIILNERMRYAILMTYLGAQDETGAKDALQQVPFPTESPAYYYAQAAWAFAHGNKQAGANWMKTAEGLFDAKQTAWYARLLYDLGWIKTKPLPVAI